MLSGDVRDVALKARRENFPIASRLLPRRYRRHLMAVYGFARSVDDLGDEAHPEDRLRLLDAVEGDLALLYSGRDPQLPVIRELAPTVRRWSIPAEPFHRLIDAGRRDQEVTRYETFDDLLAYCELSANPVGHIVLHVFDAAVPPRLTLSDHVCTALQIIEHCQDVAEDRHNGRIYLPLEDLDRFGVRPTDLDAPRAGANVRRLVAFEAERAGLLLDQGLPLLRQLRGWARLAVTGYVAGGRATLYALRRADWDVLARTPRPAKRDVLAQAVAATFGSGVMSR